MKIALKILFIFFFVLSIAGCGGGGGTGGEGSTRWCISNTSKACSGGDVYWYDSCGSQGAVYETCGGNAECINGTCAYQWANTFDDFTFDLSITVSSGGGYALTGSANDISVLRISSAGEKQWIKTYGGRPRSSIITTSDGGYAVVGVTDRDSEEGLVLVKTDSDGVLEWSKTYEIPDIGYNFSKNEMIQTADGGYAILGIKDTLMTFLLKLDSKGNLIWMYNSDNSMWGYSFVQADDGGFVIAGEKFVYEYYADQGYLEKVDSRGNYEWGFPTDSYYNWSLPKIVSMQDGSYMTVSNTNTYMRDNYGNPIGWIKEVVQVDFYGNEISTFDWDDTLARFNDIIVTSGGDLVIAGYSEDGAWIAKTDENINVIWEKTFDGTTEASEFYNVAETGDGGYIVAGYIDKESESVAIVIKMNSDGECNGCFD